MKPSFFAVTEDGRRFGLRLGEKNEQFELKEFALVGITFYETAVQNAALFPF